MKKSIKILFFGILLLAICLEIGARIIFSIDYIEKFTHGNQDHGWRQGWLKAHEGHPPDTPLSYVFDVYDAKRGWAVKPDLKDLPAWDRKTINSNSRGLRGRKEYSYERAPGTTRIAVVGDSFTFGEEIGDNETYASYLEEMIPGSEVLNFGVHGYGHDQMLVYFREEVKKYKPDIVVLGFVDEDLERNLLEFRDFAKPRFQLVGEKLELRNSPVPSPESLLRSRWKRSKFLDLFFMAKETLRWQRTAFYEEMMAVGKALLWALADEAHAIGAETVFVFLPVGGQFLDSGEEVLQTEQLLNDVCKERSFLNCFSLRPLFMEEYKAGRRLNESSHWNPYSHKLAATKIKEFMEAKNLLPIKE